VLIISLGRFPNNECTAAGKPFFVPPYDEDTDIPSLPAWNYNVSHDGRFVVCATEVRKTLREISICRFGNSLQPSGNYNRKETLAKILAMDVM
jgi:hypothetical protein